MLRIRLSRGGKKKQPYYRVVVADIDAKRDGRVVERIGHYNPLAQPEAFAIKEDRALHWLSVGAQPSDAVRRLLEKQGTYDRLERLRAGESADALVAEFEGRPVETPEEEAAPEPVVLESSEPTAHPEAIVAESETEAEGTEEPEEAGAAEEAEAPEPVVFESSEPTAKVDEDAETEEEETDAEAPEPVVMESSEPTAQVDEAESDEEETSGESSDEDEEEGAA